MNFLFGRWFRIKNERERKEKKREQKKERKKERNNSDCIIFCIL